MINNIVEETVCEYIEKAIEIMHEFGPTNDQILEVLAYAKLFYPKQFAQYESRLMYVMGLFYKTKSADGLFEQAYGIIKETIAEKYKQSYSPVQARIESEIEKQLYYSFSAPTSTGKSFVFKRLILEAKKDIVIILPSRSLISEYYLKVIELVSKEVLVLTFVDNINIKKTKRRVFILTPERANSLFKYKDKFDIEYFLMDEAQITEEEIRGLKFDSFVRRIIKEFPLAKKVFAHPFVTNPEIHFQKHDIKAQCQKDVFEQKTVGRLFAYRKDNHLYIYSPFEKSSKTQIVKQYDALIDDVFSKNGAVLVYTTKAKIYDSRVFNEFGFIIEKCNPITDPNALMLIDKLREYLGASKTQGPRQSLLLSFMERGIVLHHGSIPLKGRTLIEEFINKKFAKVCFATSTLTKGINMPFEIVYIDDFKNGTKKMETLDFKNLIGRAGRTSEEVNKFDFGFVVTNEKDVAKIKNRIEEASKIKEANILDLPIDRIDVDQQDIVEAIKNDSFNDDFNITESECERLRSNENVDNSIEYLLRNLMPTGVPIKGDAYRELSKGIKQEIKKSFKVIYASSLRNSNLTKAEQAVLSNSVQIMLWKIQGRSFKETVRLRFNCLIQRKKQIEIEKLLKEKTISEEESQKEIVSLKIVYSQKAFSIPNKKRGNIPLFDTSLTVNKCNYDMIVYDTYDYLDKVISLCLTDVICAAMEIYYEKSKEIEARAFQNYMRYGTNSAFEIMLIRYGFDFEDFDWLLPCINNVTEEEIVFNEMAAELKQENEERYRLIERFL